MPGRPGRKRSALTAAIDHAIAVLKLGHKDVTPEAVMAYVLKRNPDILTLLTGQEIKTSMMQYGKRRANDRISKKRGYIVGVNNSRVEFWTATLEDLLYQLGIITESSDFDLPHITALGSVVEFLQVQQRSLHRGDLTADMFYEEIAAIFEAEGLEPPVYVAEEAA